MVKEVTQKGTKQNFAMKVIQKNVNIYLFYIHIQMHTFYYVYVLYLMYSICILDHYLCQFFKSYSVIQSK